MQIVVVHKQARVPVTIFHIEGIVDTNSYQQLRTHCRQALETGTSHLLFDLTHVPHIGSAGLRVFLDVLNAMRFGTTLADRESSKPPPASADAFKSPHVKLLNPSEKVLRVMTMTGLSVFFEIHTDLEEAIASF